MTRDLKKAVEHYESMHDEQTGKACFYHSDFTQLVEMTGKQKDGQIDLFDLMSKCLAAGYAIGYRTAQRDNQRRRYGK